MGRRKRRKKQLKSQWKPRPPTVCPRCEGMQKRKTAIKEGVNSHYWGEIDPFLSLGDVNIHHFLCQSCGNISAYQLYYEVPW
ncbi:MAG: hypothetical protein ABIJ09_11965 [Pseudomonadota bacterium]